MRMPATLPLLIIIERVVKKEEFEISRKIKAT